MSPPMSPMWEELGKDLRVKARAFPDPFPDTDHGYLIFHPQPFALGKQTKTREKLPPVRPMVFTGGGLTEGTQTLHPGQGRSVLGGSALSLHGG